MTALAHDRLTEFEAFVLELNAATAAHILPLFRAEHGLRDKGGAAGFDPVTEADVGAEKIIRRLIAQRYPEHGVIGEELGEDRPDAEFVWVLDPVDGTRAFIAGLPTWCTLIGLRWQGQPTLGSIGQPFLDEIYLGSGASSRILTPGVERPLKVRACPDLGHAILSTTDPDGMFDAAEEAAWRQVKRASRLTRLGCDAYAYARLAAGTMDLVIESKLKPWDIEAIIPVVEGAGGRVTDWRGNAIGPAAGQAIAAGDAACLQQALALLDPAAA